MKVNCEIVQDLLPLYEDGVCSASSRAAVEEHLKSCENCRILQEGAAAIPETELVLEVSEKDEAAAGSFKKVRRRWWTSLLAVLLTIPLLLMTVNQIRGSGICFTNLDDIWAAKRFVAYLEQGEYEKAAAMYDFSKDYAEMMAAVTRPVEDYMGNYNPVQIGEETWYMDAGFAEGISLSDDPMDVWMQLIYNDQGSKVMVPEWVWEEIVLTGDMVRQQVGNAYELSNGRSFYSMDTPWGTYMVSKRAYEEFLYGLKRNVDYARVFQILPEVIYDAILPDLEHYAQGAWETTQRRYKVATEMTELEFVHEMQNQYAENLKEGFETVTLVSSAWKSCHRYGDMWNVEFALVLTYEGANVEFALGVSIVDDLIASMDGSYSGNIEWPNIIVEKLMLFSWYEWN